MKSIIFFIKLLELVWRAKFESLGTQTPESLVSCWAMFQNKVYSVVCSVGKSLGTLCYVKKNWIEIQTSQNVYNMD